VLTKRVQPAANRPDCIALLSSIPSVSPKGPERQTANGYPWVLSRDRIPMDEDFHFAFAATAHSSFISTPNSARSP